MKEDYEILIENNKRDYLLHMKEIGIKIRETCDKEKTRVILKLLD